MRIKKFLSSLPQSVLNGDEITLSLGSIRRLFEFAGLGSSDILYLLGCGSSESLRIAHDEFKVKKSVGVEINKRRAMLAGEKVSQQQNAQIINRDMRKIDLLEATVIFFWLTDDKLIEQMIRKFEMELKDGVRLITIWSPLDLMTNFLS